MEADATRGLSAQSVFDDIRAHHAAAHESWSVKDRLVIISPEAKDDLLALYTWIAAAADPKTALGYIERIETFCHGMRIASERGTRRDDIRPDLLIVL